MFAQKLAQTFFGHVLGKSGKDPSRPLKFAGSHTYEQKRLKSSGNRINEPFLTEKVFIRWKEGNMQQDIHGEIASSIKP